MTAILVLHLRRPDDPVTDRLLDHLRESLDWTKTLEPEPDGRVMLPFLGEDWEEARHRVDRGLEAAAAAEKVDWSEYIFLATPPGS